MRELIISRLNEIKTTWNGFPKGVQRWGSFYNGEDNLHVSEIVFDELSDELLAKFFETIVRTMTKQY